VKLPGAERAFVDPAKVRDYLLDPDHPVGHSKARFFGALGFTRARWPALYQVLLDLAVHGRATIGDPSPHGQKYEVHATITGPGQREACLVTVWIVLSGEDFPRLVTAFPGGPR
jgi:hypothetical protein